MNMVFACALVVATVALADDQQVSQNPAAYVQDERQPEVGAWYGWQVLAAAGFSDALMVAGAAFDSDTVVGIGLMGAYFSGVPLHLQHGREDLPRSFGHRALGTIGGGLLGVLIYKGIRGDRCTSTFGYITVCDSMIGAVYGMPAGLAAAQIVDGIFFSSYRRPVGNARESAVLVGPAVMANGRRTAVGLQVIFQ